MALGQGLIPPAFRVFTVHLSSSCSKACQLPGLLPCRLHCPGGRSAQDTRPRTLGISRLLPGMSHLASGLRCTVTRLTTRTCRLLCTPQGLGSLSVSRALAHPSNKGFLSLKSSRTSFVLTQTEIKA